MLYCYYYYTCLVSLLAADTLGHSAKDSSELAVSALGACTWYLKKSCLEHELLSLCNFELYVPLDVESVVKADVVNFAAGRQHMVISLVFLFLGEKRRGLRRCSLFDWQHIAPQHLVNHYIM